MARAAATKPAPVDPSKFAGFASAPIVEAPKPAKAGDLEQFPMEGVHEFTAIRAGINVLEAEAAICYSGLHDASIDRYISTGCSKKKRPDNFIGIEETHTCTMILSKRSTSSPLNEDEIKLLQDNNVPFDQKPTETQYFFNNEFLADPKLRAKIEKALAALELPAGVIQQQQIPGKATVTDETLDAVFGLEPDKCRALLSVVTSFSIKAKYNLVANNLAPLKDFIAGIFGIESRRDRIVEAVSADKKGGKKRGK